MVGLAESIITAQESAESREEEILRAERQAGRLRVGGTVAEQIRFGAALPRARRQARRAREAALTEIARARGELGLFRGQIRAGRERLGVAEQQRGRLERIQRILAKGGTPDILELNREDRQLVKNILEGKIRSATISKQLRALEREGLTPVFVGGELRGFESEEGLQSFELQELGFVQPSAVSQLERAGIISVSEREVDLGRPVFEPLSTVTAVERPSGRLEAALFDVRLERAQLGRDVSFGAKIGKTGGAFVGTILGGLIFGKQLITEPITTIKGIPSGLARSLKFVTGGGLAQKIVSEPEAVVGAGLGELVVFKGTGKAISLTGRGLELGRTVISPKFRPVTTRELTQFGTTEQFIGGIPEIGGVGELGLIPAGLERRAATIRPTVRGGFGFTPKEQARFIGELGPVVTAQRGFKGFDLPLEKELFATPPLGGIGFVRVSRLGLEAQKEATLADIIGGDIAFRRQKPQIIVFPEEVVGRRGGFEPFGLPSTELETILPIGKIPIRIGEPAVSIIKGRRVPIITAKIGETDISKLFRRGRARDQLSFDISSTLETRPLVSPRKLFTSLGVSTSKQLRSSLSISPRSLGVSPLPRPKRTGRISPRARPSPRVGGLSFRPSPPPRIQRGFGGLGGLSGLGFPKFREFGGFPLARRTADRRKVKPKRVRVRRRLITPTLPSFTAIVADVRGSFPREVVIAGVKLGIPPSRIRRIPRRRTARRTTRRKRRK